MKELDLYNLFGQAELILARMKHDLLRDPNKLKLSVTYRMQLLKSYLDEAELLLKSDTESNNGNLP